MIDNCFFYFKYIHHIHIITDYLKINNMNKQCISMCVLLIFTLLYYYKSDF